MQRNSHSLRSMIASLVGSQTHPSQEDNLGKVLSLCVSTFAHLLRLYSREDLKIDFVGMGNSPICLSINRRLKTISFH